eukprot:g243.t1
MMEEVRPKMISSDKDLAKLPKHLQNSLMKFQLEGVKFGIKRCDGRVLIADEMGLGKTIQAIALAAFYKDDWPLCIFCPSSLKYSWANEIHKWLPHLSPESLNLCQARSDYEKLQASPISIVTFGLITKNSLVSKHLKHFRCCIVDESHGLKSKDTVRAKVLLPVLKNSTRCILLSGTPALNRPVELYTQVYALRPKMFGTYLDYVNKYCNAKQKVRHSSWGRQQYLDVTGASNLDQLNKKLEGVMIRRRKNDVLKDLPMKRRQRIQLFVASKGKEAKELSVHLRELKNMRKTKESANDFEEKAKIMACYPLTAKAKIPAVQEYLSDTLLPGLDSNTKILLFAYHHAMLDALQACCSRMKVGCVRIDGTTPLEERASNVVKFQNDRSIQVAILGLTSAGQGLTLTKASIVVFCELHWTPAVCLQAEDRAHRIGQKNSVNCIYLTASRTLDDVIWRMMCSKIEKLSSMLDGRKEKFKAVAASTPLNRTKNRRDVRLEKSVEISNDDDDTPVTPGSIQSFFCVSSNSKKKRRRRSQSGEMSQQKKKQLTQWSCLTCTLLNPIHFLRCQACRAARPTPQKSKVFDKSSSKEQLFTAKVKKKKMFFFSVSTASNRIFVYNSEKMYLGYNFSESEILSGNASIGNHSDKSLVDEAKAFLREYNLLRGCEQMKIDCIAMRPPFLLKNLLQNKISFNRYSQTNSEFSERCRQCGKKKMNQSSLTDWSTTFCSFDCYKIQKLKTSSTAIRRQIFAIEHGICQLCKFDCHSFFLSFKSLSPPERLSRLQGWTKFRQPKNHKSLQRLLTNPVEGDFWQADHILAVVEGGGEAGLENLRTLCTPCHALETAKLAHRRRGFKGKNAKQIHAQRNARPISNFFAPRKDDKIEVIEIN